MIGTLDLKAAILVGHSAGAGDIARYIGRHVTVGVSGAVLVPAIPRALLSSKLIRNATLKIYPGAPHGLTVTHKDKFNNNLLTFVKGLR